MRSAQRAASAEQRATGQVSVASYRQIAALQARINDLTQRRSDILDTQARKQKAQAAFDSAKSKLSSTATKVAISAAPLIAATKAAVDFESAMADVRKVVDFDTPQQFAQMNEDVLKLSTNLPMAADDIAKIVAAGGQAGIARQDLMQFAEDAVKMGVAFDVTAEQAGDMMAKW
ncbi:MAG TPA: phage tail tape measure protein, partial [Megasphaera sp.]|nr:phage tail tape measure protein [Megasphaera sp.]